MNHRDKSLKVEEDEVRAARNELKRDLQKLNSSFQDKLDTAERVTSKVARSLDLSKKFRKSFWLTSGVIIGSGFILSKIMGSKKLHLTESQLRELSRSIASHINTSTHEDKEKNNHSIFNFSGSEFVKRAIVPTVANAVISYANSLRTTNQARETSNEDQLIH